MGKTTKTFYVSTDEKMTEEEKALLRQHTKDIDDKKEVEMAKKANDLIAKKESIDFMTTKFGPFEDRVLVYPDPIEIVTKGGIYKPDEALNKIKPLIGTVVFVGPGKPTINTTAMVKALGMQADNAVDAMRGDYPRWSGNDFERLLMVGNIMDLQIGEKIYYGGYAGTELPIDGVKYLIMRFADCFGRVK